MSILPRIPPSSTDSSYTDQWANAQIARIDQGAERLLAITVEADGANGLVAVQAGVRWLTRQRERLRERGVPNSRSQRRHIARESYQRTRPQVERASDLVGRLADRLHSLEAETARLTDRFSYYLNQQPTMRAHSTMPRARWLISTLATLGNNLYADLRALVEEDLHISMDDVWE